MCKHTLEKMKTISSFFAIKFSYLIPKELKAIPIYLFFVTSRGFTISSTKYKLLINDEIY